jgi:undecaprenyl-diphosphatase
MLEKLENIDRALFLKLNGFHNELWDAMMPVFTNFLCWTPLFLLVLYFLIRKYKRKSWLFLFVLPLMIVCSDQGANLIKKSVKRYRPSHNIEIAEQVHTVDGYKGGKYGFVSGHAANSFALALFMLLFFPSMNKWLRATCIVWAFFICYTRIYLGVHYPLDIIGGACIGLVSALLMYKLFGVLDKRISLQEN